MESFAQQQQIDNTVRLPAQPFWKWEKAVKFKFLSDTAKKGTKPHTKKRIDHIDNLKIGQRAIEN